MSLKPEGTASAVRLVLENKLVELNQEQKVYYIERMYRYERPQKGRQREFIQFGAE
jgi:histidyl-tRNA synthetase